MTGTPIVARSSIAIPWTPIWSKNAQASYLRLSTNQQTFQKLQSNWSPLIHPYPVSKLWQFKTASTSVWLSTLALGTWFCLKGCHSFWAKLWRKVMHLKIWHFMRLTPCSAREGFESWGHREGWGHFFPFANPSSINLESRSACND